MSGVTIKTAMVVIFCLFSWAASAEAPLVRLGYSDAPAPPYQIDHRKPAPGIAFEIIQHAASALGLSVEFLSLPNRRVQELLKAGEINGAFMFSFKAERQASAVYPWNGNQPDRTRRIAVLSYYLYKRVGADLLWDGSTLRGSDRYIGANSGYSVVGDLAKLGIAAQEARTTEQNFSKMVLGRLDAFAHQDLVADQYISTRNLAGKIEKLTPPLSTKDYFLVFSHQFVKAHPEIAELLWQKIGEIRDSVTQNVIGKYQ